MKTLERCQEEIYVGPDFRGMRDDAQYVECGDERPCKMHDWTQEDRLRGWRCGTKWEHKMTGTDRNPPYDPDEALDQQIPEGVDGMFVFEKIPILCADCGLDGSVIPLKTNVHGIIQHSEPYFCIGALKMQLRLLRL
jgi:hypothetical protein